MELDLSGLEPLDTSGLTEADALDVTGLVPLDTSGLVEDTPAAPGGDPGFISQTARGFEAGVAGGQSMAAALMTIPAFGAFQSLSNEVAAYDAIDAGREPELGMSNLAGRQQAYAAASPEDRTKMREIAQGRIGAMTEVRQGLREAWQRYSDEAKAKSGRVPNFTDIEDAAGFRDWLGFSIGQGAPYIAATTLAAMLGGAPAVAGTGLAIGAGDIQGDLMEAGIEDRGDLALTGAVPYAALEFLGPAGRYLRNVSGATMREVARKYYQRLGREVPANFVEEFVNEAGQGIIGDAVVTSQTGEAMVTDESLLRWFNEGMAGGAAGAPMGAVSAIPGRKADLPPVEITPDDVASPIPTEIIAEGKAAVQEAEAGLPADAVPAETIIGEEKAEPEPAADPAPATVPLEPHLVPQESIPLPEQETAPDSRTRQEEVPSAPVEAVPPDSGTEPRNMPEIMPEAAPAEAATTTANIQPENIPGDIPLAARTDTAAPELDVFGLKPLPTKPEAKSTDDALTFLARRGGIRDDEGHDLKAGRNLQKFVPRSGPLIRPKGMSIDDAGEALWEAGYFGPADTTPRPTERQVLDLLERGKAAPVFTAEVQAERDAETAAAEQAQAEARARADVRTEANALGETLNKSQTEEVLAAMARDKLDADEAVANYLERRAIRDESELDSYIEEPNDEARIPFDAPTETGRPAGEEGGSSERTTRAGEEGEARREPTEENGRTTGSQAPKVVSEPTDQSGQSVTPGAKKITEKDLAERRMEGRKRSTVAQKPADERLFDTGAKNQKELLSRRRGVAPPPGASNTLAINLRERLKRVGIADAVAVQAVTVIHSAAIGKVSPSQGRYYQGLIEVALDSDQAWVLDHEIIHGLRDMGLFKPAEWRALEKAARADKKRMAEVRERYADLNLSEPELVEEAIADMFADWVAGRSQVKGFLRTAFERLRAFIEALGNALSGNGFRTVGDVFGDADRGKVGQRNRQVIEAMGERFSLAPEKRDNSDNRQIAMQGFIARGQPLDRALRIPGQIFGGVNQQGEWKPGLKMFEKAERALTSAKFSDTSAFAWLNGPLETARAGLIDRYGLDPEFVKRERKLDLDKRAIAQKGAEVLSGLKSSNIGPQEAKVLQAVLTGEEIADTDMKKLAAPIRQTIDELGAEAVSLGLVSPESYERNRGTYLHRVYLKHEGDQPALSKWFSTFMANRRKKIQGSAFKGRGMFLDVTIDRAMRDSADFRDGRRGRPVKGESFVVLDKYSQKDLLESTEGDAAKPAPTIEKRVYWPSDKAVPNRFEDFANHGTWEVRRVMGDKVTLWRDFTKTEREKMGVVMDARYTIGKTFMLMAQDLSTGRFYADIAKNEEWARSQEPGGNWVNAGEYRRIRQDPSVEWVKVSDTSIPKSGGKKRWGALAGMYVRAEIWRDLNEIDIMSRPNLWTQFLTQWKLNKTARSPVVHMNNIMSNLVFMDLADVRIQDLVGGLRAYVKQTKDYEEAATNGAFGSDIISQEIRQQVLQPILDNLQKEISGGRNPVLAKAGLLGRLADVIWDKTKALDRKMIDLYRIEDEVFRMATYMRRRSLGDSAEHAADEARQQFLDYDIRAPWVNAARRSVLPFISYTYRAAPVIARSIATRPWKLGKYFAVAYAMNALGYMLAPGDEDEERRSLRPAERGYTWIGAPRMLRMPYRDIYGNPVFLDVRRWIPAGDIFDTNQGHGAFPVPAWLQFGGPLMIGAEIAFNKSAFTGDEIVNWTVDTTAEGAAKIGDFLWKSWAPSAVWIPGSWYWEKVGLAMKGAADSQGRPYPVPEAIASSFGVKLKPQDVEANFEWRAYEFDKQRQSLKAERRRVSRLLDRGHISEESFEEAVESIDMKLRRVDEEAAKILK